MARVGGASAVWSKRARWLLCGVVLATLLQFSFGATMALAATPSIDRGPAGVQNCISKCPSDTSKGPLVGGTLVTMRCWAFGDIATGNYKSDKWFYITVASGTFAGKVGWVHSSWVKDQTTVGRCGGEVPALGTDNYDGKSAPCTTALVSGVWCKNADFRGSNGSLNSGRGYAWRNCTDFAAFRMKVPAGWGNASSWDEHARANLSSWAIDSNPHLGDIAQNDTAAGGLGHVAVVRQVGIGTHAGQILIEEYNAGAKTINGAYYGDGKYYNTRWLSVSGYEFIRKIK